MSDDASLLAARVRYLQEVTARATLAPTVDEVARVLVDEGVAALGGTMGALWLVEGAELALAHWAGAGRTPAHERPPLAGDNPLALAARTGQPVWVDDRRAYATAFPAAAARSAPGLGADAEIAMACLPLLAAGQPIGVFLCAFATARTFPPDERAFLATITRQCAVAIERLRLIASERELRLRAEALATGLARLQELAGDLSLVVDLADVARVFLDRGRAAVGAYNAGIWVIDGDHAHLVGHLGYTPETAAVFERFRYGAADNPLARAITGEQPVFLSGREVYRSQFGELEAQTRHLNPPGTVEAIACLPMIVDGRVLGAVGLTWTEPHAFDASERELLILMVRHGGQAVERARLHGIRERTRVSQRLLADAGAVLASSLDYVTTLQNIAERLVPDAADWCFIDVIAADGSFDRVAVAHADPTKTELAAVMRRRYEAIPDAASGSSRVIERGEPQLVRAPDDAIVAELITDPARRRALEELGLRSWVTAPLRARGRAFGALVLGSTTRSYDEADLELAIELARRAGNAIDNARLYAAEAAARHDAETANRTKDEFLAMLGHELRNPLAPIVTALQLMRERDAVAFVRERAIVERQVHHLVRLVDDLLDVSRIARGKVELRRAPVPLADAVARALEATAPLADERGHVVSVDVPAGLVIDADRDRLTQVIVNLVTNAARYTPRGGRIGVTAARDGDAVRVVVRDTGPGIPAGLLPTLFEPFVQGERGVDRAEGGLGLGLAIVRNLVEQHGGRVAATNPPGGGAELAIWLPSASPAGSEPVVGAAASGAIAAPARALRVLVVDDNVDAAEMLGELLRVFGHVPTVVHAASEALAQASPAPDVAFLDIGLPDLDGYELARRLRALPGFGRAPLVALTGFGQPSDRATSRAAGFAEHLVKPVDIAKLRAILDAVAAS